MSRARAGYAATSKIQEVSPDDVAPPDNVASLPEGPKPIEGVSARLIARAGTQKTAPGGVAQFFVVLMNEGSEPTTAGQPVTLTLRVPYGFSFAGITNADTMKGLIDYPGGDGLPAGTTWVCHPGATAGTEDCTFGVPRAGGGVEPLAFPKEYALTAFVKYTVSPTFKPAPNGTTVDLRSTLSAPGNTATTDQSVAASTTVVSGATGPEYLPDIDTKPDVARVGGEATESLVFVNVGSGPGTSSGSPAIKLTNVLPPSLVSSWTSSGAGWSCTGPQTSSPTCSYTGTVAAGAATPKLSVAYHVSAAGAAPLDLRIGGPTVTSPWTIEIAGNGANGLSTSTYPAQIDIGAPEGSDLTIEARAEDGVDAMLPGLTTSTVQVGITNLGEGPATQGIGIAGEIPTSIVLDGVTEIAPAAASTPWKCETAPLNADANTFDCRPTGDMEIPPGRTLHLAMAIKSAPDAKPGTGEIKFLATATDEISGIRPTVAAVPIFTLEGNAGFPTLTLFRSSGPSSTTLEAATDGAPAAFETNTPFSERLDLRNAGGADIPPASEMELFQSFTAGVTIERVSAPAGWRCTPHEGSAPSLTCLVSFGTAVAPAAVVTGPTVTVSDSRETPPGTNWAASVRLTRAGAPKALGTAVLVSVNHRTIELLPDLSDDLVPTAGGVGKFTFTAQNGGDTATIHPIEVGLKAPPGSKFQPLTASGWSCETAGNATSARCTTSSIIGAGQNLAPIHLALDFSPKTASKSLALTAHISDGDLGPRSPKATLPITPRPTIRATIKDPDSVEFADEPLTSGKEALTPSVVTLEGDGSGGSGLGLTYSWKQLCTSAAGVSAAGGRCAGITPSVNWIGGAAQPATADASFAMPPVTSPTLYVFELTVTDGSATASSYVKVHELPEMSSKAAPNLEKPNAKATPEDGPSTEHVHEPLPAEKLTGKGATTPLPTTKTTKTVLLTHSLRDNTPSTSTTTTTGVAATLAPLFCDLVTSAANSAGGFSKSFAGVDVSFSGIHVTGSGCAADTSVSFSDSSIEIGSAVKLTGVSGSISKDGIAITSATLTGPAAWNSPTLTLKDGSQLVLPFSSSSSSSSDISLEGSLSGDGLLFIPLPSGWTSTTSLTFAHASGTTTVSVASAAIGPKNDASPDSEPPSIALNGSVSTDGTFSVSADVERVVQLAGHSISLHGTIARATPDGEITKTISGSLDQPFDIVPGLSLKTLSVSIAPTADSLGLTGEGSIAMTTPNGSLGVGVKLTYSTPKNWSLAVDGQGTASWSPLPGLTIAPSDVHGSITAADDKYTFGVEIAPAAAWNPTSSVSIANLKLSLGNTCQDSGAPCPTDASLFLQVSGDASFTLPVVGTVKSNIAGVLALPTGAFSTVVKLTAPLSIGGGIGITDAQIAISKGLPVQPGVGAPTSESVDNGGLQIAIQGSATVPTLGKLLTVQAAYSSQGWSIAAPLGTYSLPGGGSQLADTVVGWASYATTLKITDPITKAVSTIPLPANTFEVSGSFATPSWLKQMLKMPSDINGRATGALDLSSGDFSLRMEFAAPANAYLYGNASSATNVKLTKSYFELVKKGTDFSIALGGEAGLNTASGGGLKPGSVTLTVALSYAVTSQTVAGSLSLNSAAGWQNAFGAQGLTLYGLAVSFQLNLASGIPGLGVAAQAELPPSIRSQLGMPAGVVTTLVANISVTNPCIGIDVSPPMGSVANVLDIGSGAVTARQFTLEIAPSGCVVGTFKYDPGLSLNFDGAIAGLKVAIAAHLGFSPFAFDSKVTIGQFSAGGLNVDQTQLEISYSTSKFRVAFSGGATVLGTKVAIAGAVEQNGTTTKIDFLGTANQIPLSPAVLLSDVSVKAHVETGPTTTIAITASGKANILGSTASADFSFAVKDGAITDLSANVKMTILVGGSSGLKLDGTFKLDYGVNRPFALDANVTGSVGSYTFGNASLSIRPNAITVSASLSAGNVFSAQLAGAIYYGTVPAGTKIAGPNNTMVNAQTGDFVLSAKDVKLNLGGFSTSGTVQIGRAGGNTWTNIAAKVQLLGTGDANSVSVAGTYSSTGDFSFTGAGNLSLLGTTANMNVSVVKTGATVSVKGSTTVNVLGSSIALSGDFLYDNGTPLFRLKGTGNLTINGFSVANAAFTYSNFKEDAGFSANINVNAGSYLSFSGKLTISNGLYYLNANGALNVSPINATANVTLTNCVRVTTNPKPYPANFRDYNPIRLGFLNLYVPSADYYRAIAEWSAGNVTTCTSALPGPTLDASASFGYGGFSFGVNLHVNPGGSFVATAQAPASGTFNGRTGELSLAVVAFYAELNYSMKLTIQSASPHVALSGSGDGGIYGHAWTPFSWGGWSRIVGVSASINTNPFSVCGYATVWGYSFGRCFS